MLLLWFHVIHKSDCRISVNINGNIIESFFPKMLERDINNKIKLLS